MIRHSQSTWTLWNKLRVASPLPEFILLSVITCPIIQGLWKETHKDKKTNPDAVTVYLRGRAIWKTLESSRKGNAVFWGRTWERSELQGSSSPGKPHKHCLSYYFGYTKHITASICFLEGTCGFPQEIQARGKQSVHLCFPGTADIPSTCCSVVGFHAILGSFHCHRLEVSEKRA